jgi:hypothetical protein
VFLAAAACAGVMATVAAPAVSTPSVTSTLTGIEVPPISSTRGTFVGVGRGAVPFSWRVQILHRPLSTGTTVPITGGRLSVVTLRGARATGVVTGGSVTVVDRGPRCTSQRYRVETVSSIGTFVGTLTHHRRSLLGRCLITSASVEGSGSLAVPQDGPLRVGL